MHMEIKNATLAEVEMLLEWAADEGWNPGINDARIFYESDPLGFFIGYIGDKPVAAISNVCYGRELGFIGLYIVAREYRGQGYGYQIWQHALAQRSIRNCGLDGVIAQQHNYRKSGFHRAYKHIRYKMAPCLLENRNRDNLHPVAEVNWSQLLDFDRIGFPAPREAFLRAWVNNYTTLVYRDHEDIRGFGTIRKCREGYKIGPLFAENREIAQDIVVGLVNSLSEVGNVYLDIPDLNPEALLIVEYLKMTPVFETARMYLHPVSGVDIYQVFGVTTLELG